ncbi:MAG: YIP1 family protein [Pseudomonadota bacterium]
MSKPTINAKAVLKDIRNGASKSDLMEKYKLSPKGLESLYKKLVAAGFIPAGELTRRTVKPAAAVPEPPSPESRPTAKPRPGQGTPKPKTASAGEPSQAKSKSAELRVSEKAKAVADDINAGMHDNEILRRHEISPGQFREIKERLVQVGLLKPAASETGPRKASKICPSCGHEVPPAAAKCNHCGEWLDDQAQSAQIDRPGPAGRPAPPPPPPPRPLAGPIPSADDNDLDDDEECPWEERENYGVFGAYIQTATRCMLTPKQFFSKLPTSGGWGNPILFAIFSMVAGLALGYALVQLFQGGVGFIGLLFVIVVSLVVLVIAVPVSMILSSGILHLCLLLVGGAGRGYEATLRVVSYASVTSLFNAVPVVGTIVSLYGLVLTVIGLRETHRTSTGKAAAAVALPVVVALSLAVLSVLWFLSTAKSAFTQAADRTDRIELSGRELPSEVCVAVREFLSEVDFAADIEDPKAAQEQLQRALQSLNETLDSHKSHPDTEEVRKLATVYGLSGLAQRHLKSAAPDAVPAFGEGEEQREKLSSLCPED